MEFCGKTIHNSPRRTGKNKIDNHAVTICVGPNWKLLNLLAGGMLQCDAFSYDYQTKLNMPVAKCATTYSCPGLGQFFLLIADQVLWFGSDLYCSLNNPHQILCSDRHSHCDDLWDPSCELGLYVSQELISTLPGIRSKPFLCARHACQAIGNVTLSYH